MHVSTVLRENPNFRLLYEDLLGRQAEGEKSVFLGLTTPAARSLQRRRYLKAYTLYAALEEVEVKGRVGKRNGNADAVHGILKSLSFSEAKQYLENCGLDMIDLTVSDLEEHAKRNLLAEKPASIIKEALPAVEDLLLERCRLLVEFYECSTTIQNSPQTTSANLAKMSTLAQEIVERNTANSRKAVAAHEARRRVWALCGEYTDAACNAIECCFTYLALLEAGHIRERDETLNKYYAAFIRNAALKYRTIQLGLLKSFYSDEVLEALQSVRKTYQAGCDERTAELSQLEGRLAQFRHTGGEFPEIVRQYAACLKEIGEVADQIAEMRGRSAKGGGARIAAGGADAETHKGD